MRFYLHYRGELSSNGRPCEKHRLRKYLDPQLRDLWRQRPLSEHRRYVNDLPSERSPSDTISIIEQVGSLFFAPLVTDKLDLICALQITLLRPEEPGHLLGSGDLDNRLKTLFDALSMPPDPNQIPHDELANSRSQPLYCLLKDDKLITSLDVRCDRLLDAKHAREVILLIRAHVSATRATFSNIGIAGAAVG